MILKFPDLQALQTFLEDKAVPRDSLATPIELGFDENNALWVDSPVSLSRTQLALLRKLNVEMPKTCPISLNQRAPNWAQLFQTKQVLLFPTPALFRMALSEQLIPRSITQQPVNAAWDEQSRLWVQLTLVELGNRLETLRELGVETPPLPRDLNLQLQTCWPQLLPLVVDIHTTHHLEQKPVLFQVQGSAALAQLSGEMLRLGNDRQNYRWMEEDKPKGSAEGMALLRVIGPPYYSLLTALDRTGDTTTAPVAYVEQAPRIWVQLGYRHPLVQQISVPAGQILLLRSPNEWWVLPESPWRDLYEILEFVLPQQPTPLVDKELKTHFAVKLSLRPGGPVDGGELWVLDDNPIEDLNRFVQEADDHLLNRLAFAIGEFEGKQTIVVRILQSRQTPPVLVFERATAYRSVLKLTNLFVPCGQGLRPPLRRDQVRKLLAPELPLVYWLKPLGQHQFVPQSLPENAFRPLQDWVDYILDHEKQDLKAWIGAAQFEFEPFICTENDPTTENKPKGADKTPRADRGSVPSREGSPTKKPVQGGRSNQQGATVSLAEEAPIALEVDRLKLQAELRETESHFIELEGGLDLPERIDLWPRLAGLYTRLDNPEDACISWINAIWNQDHPPAAMCLQWLRLEASRLQVNSRSPLVDSKPWLNRLPDSFDREKSAGDSLDALLQLKDPMVADVRTLAALLVGIHHLPLWAPAIEIRLNPIQQFLEQRENLLPIRVVWLAWRSLFRQSQGDILSLARTRDRLLERLYQVGLRPEQDFPCFLRFAGQTASVRFRAVRNWIVELAERAKKWVLEDGRANDLAGSHPAVSANPGNKSISSPMMEGYVDLIFSFGLASLSEITPARKLLQQGKDCFQYGNDVQQVLMKAYQYRIEQAILGKPHTGPLPAELLDQQKAMPTLDSYLIDRFRKRSRVLEPEQTINPYINALKESRIVSEWKELVNLEQIKEPEEIISRIKRLLKDATNDSIRLDVLQAGLNFAPRLGHGFARDILAQTLLTLSENQSTDVSDSTKLATLIEQGLFVASHYDFRDQVNLLINKFKAFFIHSNNNKNFDDLGSIAGQCFRRLRKLGMRNEIDSMILQIHDTILKDRNLETMDSQTDPTWNDCLRVLLHVASAWYYSGKNERAEPIVQAARKQLYATPSTSAPSSMVDLKKKKLACTYALAVGQGPLELAQKRLEELFTKLSGMKDPLLSENKPYLIEQIDIIESVVLAVISDDFTLGGQTRRWLDDDEFLIRRSIHQDLREASR